MENTANLSAVFGNGSNLQVLASACVARDICDRGDLDDIFELESDVAALVIYQLEQDKVADYVNRHGIQNVAKFFVNRNSPHLLACMAAKLEKAKRTATEADVKKTSEAFDGFHYHVDTIYKLYTGRSPLSVYDAMGTLHEMGGFGKENSDALGVNGIEVNICRAPTEPHLAYVRTKHSKADALDRIPVPGPLWSGGADKSDRWYLAGDGDSDSEDDNAWLAAKRLKWDPVTAPSTVARNFVGWTVTADLSECEKGTFKKFGHHGSRVFYYTLAYARRCYALRKYHLSLGHFCQVFSYFAATEDGQTDATFDEEVKERRLDLYLLGAVLLSKFGGDDTVELCQQFLAKAASCLTVSRSGSVDDARHAEVLLAAQDFFYSRGFLDASQTVHLALHNLPNVSRGSVYYIKSCLLLADHLTDVIENCLAYRVGARIQHERKCCVSERSTCAFVTRFAGIMKLANIAHGCLAKAVRRARLAADDHPDYALELAEYENLSLFYEVLLLELTCSGASKYARYAMIERLQKIRTGDGFARILYGRLGGELDHRSQETFRIQVERERARLQEAVPETDLLAKVVFRHCVSVVCVSYCATAGNRGTPPILCANMGEQIEALRSEQPNHHRLPIMTFFNTCCFNPQKCSSNFRFTASSFVTSAHPLRKNDRLHDRCLCPGPYGSSACRCYEIQEGRSTAWTAQPSVPVPSDVELSASLLNHPAALALPAHLSRARNQADYLFAGRN